MTKEGLIAGVIALCVLVFFEQARTASQMKQIDNEHDRVQRELLVREEKAREDGAARLKFAVGSNDFERATRCPELDISSTLAALAHAAAPSWNTEVSVEDFTRFELKMTANENVDRAHAASALTAILRSLEKPFVSRIRIEHVGGSWTLSAAGFAGDVSQAEIAGELKR